MKANEKTNINTFASYFFMVCLVFSVLAKPANIIFNHFGENKLELFDDSNKNEQSEKEIDVDFENEKNVLQINEFKPSTIDLNWGQKFFNLHENILDFNLSIHLPPPEVS